MNMLESGLNKMQAVSIFVCDHHLDIHSMNVYIISILAQKSWYEILFNIHTLQA